MCHKGFFYIMSQLGYFYCIFQHTTEGNIIYVIMSQLGELKLFVFVLLIFLLAYGITAQGLLYHERTGSWTILKDVFYYPYWQLYGELFFEAIGEGCDGRLWFKRCWALLFYKGFCFIIYVKIVHKIF